MTQKKTTLWGILIFLFVCLVPATSFALDGDGDPDFYFFFKIGEPRAIANREWLDIDPSNDKVVPIILNSKAMVPVQFLASNLGAEVTWDAATKTVVIVRPPIPGEEYYPAKKEKIVRITLNAPEMLVDGKSVPLVQPAVSIQGRTMIPVRELAEAFDLQVEYYPEKQAIYIDSYRVFPEADIVPVKMGVLTRFQFETFKEYDKSVKGYFENKDVIDADLLLEYKASVRHYVHIEHGINPDTEILDETVKQMSRKSALEALEIVAHVEEKYTVLERSDTELLVQYDFKWTGVNTLEYRQRDHIYIRIEGDTLLLSEIVGATEDLEMNKELVFRMLKSLQLQHKTQLSKIDHMKQKTPTA